MTEKVISFLALGVGIAIVGSLVGFGIAALLIPLKFASVYWYGVFVAIAEACACGAGLWAWNKWVKKYV